MNRDVFQIIKKQIDRQTKSYLNTNIDSLSPVSVDQDTGSNITNSSIISPEWIKGSYTLQRTEGLEGTPQIEVEEFLNYSGAISWQNLRTQAVVESSLSAYSNLFFGVQIFTTRPINLPISLITSNGIAAVYVKSENNSSFIEKHIQDGSQNTDLYITIDANSWVTLIITFYSYAQGAQCIFGTDFSGVLSWRPIDIYAPDVPTWSADPEYIITDGDVARGKIRLRWEKDTSVGFGGNGIYRDSYVNSGQSVVKTIPATLFSTFFNTKTEKDRWILCDSGGTINSGDVITFDATGSSGTVQVSKVETNMTNPVPNCAFQNGINGWKYTTGALKTDVNAKITANYFNLKNTTFNTRFSVQATYTPVSYSNQYMIGIMSSANITDDRHYGLGGYGIAPSNWQRRGGVTTILATLRGVLPYMRIARTTSAGTIRTTGVPFFVSSSATYHMICFGSFDAATKYKVEIVGNTGNLLATSPTLLGSVGFSSSSFVFTPSANQFANLRFSILATSSVGSINMGLPKWVIRNDSRDYDEFLEIRYYNSSKVACATPRLIKTIGWNADMETQLVALSSLDLPTDCAYVKVACVASLNGATSVVSINRRIYNAFISSSFNPNFKFGIFATQYTLLRLNGTKPAGTPDVYFTKSEHITDRIRQADDGSVVLWDDFNIQNNTSYSYRLDAFDSSAFKNRSEKTVVKLITSGDTTAPKSPSGYQINQAQGGLNHFWTTPTATDFKAVRCYTDAGLTNLLFEKHGSPNQSVYYPEIVPDFNGVKTRYVTAIDMWGNESASVSATGTVLPSEISLPFNWKLHYASGSLAVSSNQGWYNQAITASITNSSNVAIASYQYQLFIPEVQTLIPSYTNWINFNGAFSCNQNYVYMLRFRIKDIYGNYSDIKDLIIKIDTKPPRISDRASIWDSSSSGYDGYNLLNWDNSLVSDKYDAYTQYSSTFDRSGLTGVYLRRSEVSLANKNPLFQMGASATSNVTGWEGILSAGVAASLNTIAYNGDKAYKIKGTSGAYTGELRADAFRVNAGDTLSVFCRVLGSVSNATLGLYISNKDYTLNNAVGTLYNFGASATWKYLSVNYTVNVTATLGTRMVIQKVGGGSTSDYFIVDEFVAVVGKVMATIGEFGVGTSKYLDRDVSPWKHYVYDLIYMDEVGWYSDRSSLKYASPKADYRDSFRNIIDNSSFERTYETTNGTLNADSWENKEYTGVASKTTRNPYQVLSGSAYNGGNYLAVRSGNADFVAQNDIHVLPFTGASRKFVLSGYLRSNNPGGLLHRFGIRAYNNEHTLVSEKYTLLTSSNVGTSWQRISATFSVSVPSIKTMSVYFGGSVIASATLFVDAVQLEEKDSLPPRDYYDNKSITADYLQGNLIRGHMIEANTIFAENIKAGTITATLIKAGTITASLIKAGSITATQLAANTITVDELNLNNARIWIRDKSRFDIELRPLSATTGTIGWIHLCAGTYATSPYANKKPYGYYNVAFEESSGSTYVRYGHMDLSCSYSNYAYQGNRTGYTYPCFVARAFPYYSSGQSMFVLKNTGNNSFLYTAYRSMLSDPYISGVLSPSVTTIPYDSTYSRLGDLKYMGGYLSDFFVFGQHRITDDKSLNFYKLGPTGAVSGTYEKLANGTINCSSFDCATSTLFSLFSEQNTATLTLVGYDNSLSVVLPTIEIETFSGFTSSFGSGIDNGKKSRIQYCAIAVATANVLCVAYKYYINSLVYYKFLDFSGNAIIGVNSDLSLTNFKLSEQKYSGVGIGNLKLVKSFGGNILCYLVPDGTKQTDNTPTNGAGVYLSQVDPTVSLEYLFNRLN